jgi:hypothetical protein
MDPRYRHLGLRWQPADEVKIRVTREDPTGLGLHAGGAGSPTRKKVAKSVASGRNGWETRSRSTNGTSTLTTPTIHGLRGTGILARAEQGYEVDQIANDIGMSRQNVDHYMRFGDQMKVGADGQKRLRLVTRED